ncbi:MAG TPA: hypothetical protein VKS25_02300 [Solirubrobacteraceae bacterium]|nr:hypothetical protein [Solirubrobacteraceae bacterium]
MRLGRLLLAGTVAIAAACGVSSAADGDTTLQQPLQGVLVGVGPTQQSLIVQYNNEDVAGCGILGVTPTVVEGTDSVQVSLEATVDVQPSAVACATVLVVATISVPLPAALDGRAVTGIQVLGGALAAPAIPAAPGAAGPGMPSLVGLSPHDARLMLTPARALPHPYELVVHRTHRAGAGALPRVIAQSPMAGSQLRRQPTVVVVTVAP